MGRPAGRRTDLTWPKLAQISRHPGKRLVADARGIAETAGQVAGILLIFNDRSRTGARCSTVVRGPGREYLPEAGEPVGRGRDRNEEMFAVLKTGGKQYKVASGDVLRVEKIAADAGETIQFNDILMIGDAIGAPLVADAGVQATVIDQIKGDKTINYVRRRRKHSSKRTKGHRQQLTLIRVTDLLATGADKSGVKAAIGAAIASALAHNNGGMAQPRTAAQVAEGDAPVKTAKKSTKTKSDAAKIASAGAPKAAAAPKAEKPAVKAAAGGDDLKVLSGVGPALEKKLHEHGITTYAQIAAWTEADVEDFGEKLSFKGRIEREGWIEQAKTLAK